MPVLDALALLAYLHRERAFGRWRSISGILRIQYVFVSALTRDERRFYAGALRLRFDQSWLVPEIDAYGH